MTVYVLVGGVVVATIGFMAGLFLFRVKSRWCPACGAWTSATRPTYTERTAQPR